MPEPFFLGVEGGATKTTGVLADADLRVVARFVGRPTNLHAVGRSEAQSALTEVLLELLTTAGTRRESLAASALCLAGIRTAQDVPPWRQIAVGLRLPEPLFITHDAAAGLAAGSADGTGILVVCGTGSVVYGRRADGAEKFVGGRGPLLGDEGSGFDIGHRALRAAVRSADGRGERTLLERLIPERLGLACLDELVPWVSPFAKDRVAGVAAIVFEAAEASDAVAAEIVKGAVEELARSVGVVAHALWPGGGLNRVVLSGGVLCNQPSMRLVVAAAICERLPGVKCSPPEVEGAVGAARLARQAHVSAREAR